jgi:hypothetical protein
MGKINGVFASTEDRVDEGWNCVAQHRRGRGCGRRAPDESGVVCHRRPPPVAGTWRRAPMRELHLQATVISVMAFAPALRRLTFTTHVTSSVGWIGAVLVFLALAVIGLTSQDERTVRGAHLVMAPAAWFVLVPLAHASLFSGIALSLGTPWGLFRHYWVVFKLGITLFSTVILMIYMGTFRQMAGVAADPVVELALVRNPSPVVHAILALILLLSAVWLAVYKPFGLTPYAIRTDSQRQPISATAVHRTTAPAAASSTSMGLYIVALVLAVMLVVVLLHLTGASFEH